MAKTASQGVSARPAYLRLPLAFLELLFLFLVARRLHLGGLVGGFANPLLWLVAFPVVLLCLPTTLLARTGILLLFVGANSAVLVKLTGDAGGVGPWVVFGYLLLLLMAALTPSRIQFLGIGALLCILYGLSIVRYESMLAEQGFLVPIMLAMLMVYSLRPGRHEGETRAAPEAESSSEGGVCDPLTGLPTRAEFLARMWRAVECARKNEEFMFAVLFVDLDGFKPINDGLGHKAGDAVLKETARRIQMCLRKGDVVARYGGDEFTLLVHNVTGKQDAVRVAERVLRKVTEPLLIGQRVQVGASIGIALSTNIHSRPEDLIRDADLAMYHAKSQGKGRYEFSDQLRDTKVLAGTAGKKLG